MSRAAARILQGSTRGHPSLHELRVPQAGGLHAGGLRALHGGSQPCGQLAPQGRCGIPAQSSLSPEFVGGQGWDPSSEELAALLSGHRGHRAGWGSKGTRAAPSQPPAPAALRHVQLVRRLLQQHLGCGPGGQPEGLWRPAGGEHRAGAAAAALRARLELPLRRGPGRTGPGPGLCLAGLRFGPSWQWGPGSGVLAAGWSLLALPGPQPGLQAASLAQALVRGGTAYRRADTNHLLSKSSPFEPPACSRELSGMPLPDSHRATIPVHKWGL